MPNIIKAFNLILLFGIFSFQLYGQEIINSSNIEVNGEVYGVKKINAFGEHFAICGNFTQISNSVTSLNNLGFVDVNNFTAENFSFINSIDGPINDIEAFTYYNNFSGQMEVSLYIGGAFTQVNGLARNGLACFSSPLVIGNNLNSLSITGWDPKLVGNAIVHDLQIQNDTLYVGGDFIAINNYTSANDERPGIAAFNIISGNPLNMFNLNDACNSILQFGSLYETKNIELTNNRILLAGNYHSSTVAGSYIRFDYSGCFDQSFGFKVANQYSSCCYNTGGYDVAVAIDSTYCGITKLGTNPPELWFYEDTTDYSQTLIPQNNFNSIIYSPPTPTGGVTFDYSSVAAYKDIFYITRKVNYPSSFPSITYPTIIGLDSTGLDWSDPSMNTDFIDINNEHIFVQDNLLFASKNGTINFSPHQRTGLIIFCLEPDDPKFFNVFDTTVCHNDTITYSIPPVQFADGYEWTFSNQDVDLDTTALVTNFFDSSTPSVNAVFLESFTSGTLTVTPYSNCKSNTYNNSKVYSEPISININLNPLPNIIPLQDTTITCYTDTIDLVAQSDTPNVNYYWNSINGSQFTEYTGQTYTISAPDTFKLKVEATDGCLNFDTVIVDIDTLRPNFDPISGPFVLTCSDTLLNIIGHCNNLTDTITWWKKVGNIDTLPNPVSISSQGEYRFYTQNLTNGCIDSTAILIDQNMNPPPVSLVGYPDTLSTLDAYDTLNCYSDSLLLQCYSTDSNTTVNWIDTANQNLLGTSQLITSSGYYYVYGYNDSTGCDITKPFLITEDFSLPLSNIDTTTIGKLNCSNDSLILTGSSPTPNTSLSWTGNTIPPSPNPITINTPGVYTLNVTKLDNGCTSQDSIEIIQDSSIDLYTTADTFACDNDLVTVSASHLGTISGVNYSWNNGDLGNVGTFTANGSFYAIVEVSGNGGCYGTDSILISTPPYPEVDFQGFQPCGSNAYGSIVASPVSGWAPFEYAVDDTSLYQSSPTLDSLVLGTYTIWVRDTLNCQYQFQATIDQSSQVSTPEFLVSTYNQQTDTLIAIDVSSPQPDSISWDFPIDLILLGDENGSPLFLLPDTGSFDITMNAFYGTCESSLTKSIHVSEFDPSAATLYNQNGIDTTIVYPNPNDGIFNLEVILDKSQRVNIEIVDIMGLNIIPPIQYSDTDHIQEQITLPAATGNGTYYVKVIAEFDTDYVQFVISN